MVFSSPLFLFLFLPIVLGLYFITPYKGKNFILLVFSLFFYAWGEGLYVIIMIASILFNYAIARISTYFENHRSYLFITGIIGNLLLLIYFKYSGFLIANLNIGFYEIGINQLEAIQIHLPIGISFFTFQSISYLIDVWKNKKDIQKNPINLGLYIALFPQLIAGPIVRFNDIKLQLEKRKTTFIMIALGSERFIIGLFKKVVIANGMGKVTDSLLSLNISSLDSKASLTAMVAYSFQIYFDFSGYSDMAIGIGRMMGFKFHENFRHPYASLSIQEFWRRWHISLSSWFRDYLYIPLGGSRKGKTRMFTNLFIVFFLTGLWHGANWNFILWGLFHGLFLVLERQGFSNILNRTPILIRRLYVIVIVLTGWILFRIENLNDAFIIFTNIYSFTSNSFSTAYLSMLLTNEVLTIFILGTLFSFPIFKVLKSVTQRFTGEWFRAAYYSFLLVTVLISISYLSSSSYNPFIYFRF